MFITERVIDQESGPNYFHFVSAGRCTWAVDQANHIQFSVAHRYCSKSGLQGIISCHHMNANLRFREITEGKKKRDCGNQHKLQHKF